MEERQPRTDQTNPWKRLRHATGNKPLHLTELRFLKREIRRDTKEDTPNRLHGQQCKQAAWESRFSYHSKWNSHLVSGNLLDTRGWWTLNSVKFYCIFLLPSWDFYDDNHFLHMNSVSSKSFILIEDVPLKFNMRQRFECWGCLVKNVIFEQLLN